MATEIRGLKDKNDDLVLNARNAAVIATPYGVGQIPAKITQDAQGNLLPLPTGWKSFGELDNKTGFKITPDIKTTEIEGYGSLGSRRTIKTGESVQFMFAPQETRDVAVSMFWSVDLAKLIEDANGEVLAKRSYEDKQLFWSLILIGQDDAPTGVKFPYWVFPKVTVVKTDGITLGMGDAVTYPLTVPAYEDVEYGAVLGIGLAGPGQYAVNGVSGFESGS